MKKIKVLWLFAHLHKGGMQRAVSNISQALPDDFEQHVAFFGTENPGFRYKGKLHNFGIPGSLELGTSRRIVNGVLRLQKLRRFIRRNEFDVVVSFGESANLYNIFSFHDSRKVLTLRVASIDRSQEKKSLRNRLSSYLLSFCYERADKIVAVSGALGEQMRKKLRRPEKVTVISNLYHVDKIRTLSKKSLPDNLKFLNTTPFILNVGSYTFQKGQDDLLKIFSELYKTNQELRLVLMGRGEWKTFLQQEAENLGVGDNVVFVDFDPNPYRFMARAKVFVLPSRFEGFPNVLVEAMICGAPVVAFDCPTGPDEILQNSKYGYLVKYRNVNEAAKAIYDIVSTEQTAGKLKILSQKRGEDFSIEKIIFKWIEVLKK